MRNRYVRKVKQALAADPSLQPPKKWWDKMYNRIKKQSKDYSDKRIRETIGDIWYHDLSTTKRREIRERYGKKYGPAPKAA